MTMHPNDAKDEADFQLLKAQIFAAMKPDAAMTMKVYALLDCASSMCQDIEFLEGAFIDVIFKREMK